MRGECLLVPDPCCLSLADGRFRGALRPSQLRGRLADRRERLTGDGDHMAGPGRGELGERGGSVGVAGKRSPCLVCFGERIRGRDDHVVGNPGKAVAQRLSSLVDADVGEQARVAQLPEPIGEQPQLRSIGSQQTTRQIGDVLVLVGEHGTTGFGECQAERLGSQRFGAADEPDMVAQPTRDAERQHPHRWCRRLRVRQPHPVRDLVRYRFAAA